MSHPSARPDLEDLAAFVDGRLAADLRQPVLDRLAADEDYYEVYTELLSLRDEDEADAGRRDGDPQAVPVIRPAVWRRGGPWGVAALAAVLAVVVFAPRFFAPVLTVEEVIAGLGSAVSPDSYGQDPQRYFRSGHQDITPLDPGELADNLFLLGVLEVDRALAQLAGEGEIEAERDRQIARISRAYPVPETAAAGDGQTLEDRLTATLAFPEDLFFFRYGAWCRGAWLALGADPAAYFARRPVRAFLRRSPPPGAEGEVAGDLEQLGQAVEAKDWQELKRLLPAVAAPFGVDLRAGDEDFPG